MSTMAWDITITADYMFQRSLTTPWAIHDECILLFSHRTNRTIQRLSPHTSKHNCKLRYTFVRSKLKSWNFLFIFMWLNWNPRHFMCSLEFICIEFVMNSVLLCLWQIKEIVATWKAKKKTTTTTTIASVATALTTWNAHNA